MKYNIVKVMAPANNTLNQRYMDVNLLDTQTDVYEYLRDEVECYKGDRDLLIPSVIDLSPSHDNKEPILRIENDDVVVWYYLKHEEVEHYKKEWETLVDTSKNIVVFTIVTVHLDLFLHMSTPTIRISRHSTDVTIPQLISKCVW